MYVHKYLESKSHEFAATQGAKVPSNLYHLGLVMCQLA
jgi:hypothetical protein